MAPLTARAQEVEQPVEPPPHVGGPRPPAARLGRGDQRLDEAILLIAQRLAGAEVADQRTVLGCPHRGAASRERNRPLPTATAANSIGSPAVSRRRPFQNGLSAKK